MMKDALLQQQRRDTHPYRNELTTMENEKNAVISSLKEKLHWSLVDSLKTGATSSQIIRFANFIYNSMSLPSRCYHNVGHALDVASRVENDPIQTLAALFHDVVYLTSDGCLSDEQSDVLRGIVIKEHDTWILKQENMVTQVFGYNVGCKLDARSGVNEFLSAVSAFNLLQDTVPCPILMQIATCIEATIPFRPPNALNQLFNRVQKLAPDNDTAIKWVQCAAQLANADNWHWVSDDLPWFLDNSWKLLPEWNPELKSSSCTLGNVQKAFFGFYQMGLHTNVDLIFSSFHDVPTQAEMATMTHKAKSNMSLALSFIGIKLVTNTLLLAAAELTGGDLLMASVWKGKMDNVADSTSSVSVNAQVLHSVQSGEDRADFGWDSAKSPLAAFTYRCMGDDGVTHFLETNREFLCKINRKGALEVLRPMTGTSILSQVTKFLASAVPEREPQLLKLCTSLPDC